MKVIIILLVLCLIISGCGPTIFKRNNNSNLEERSTIDWIKSNLCTSVNTERENKPFNPTIDNEISCCIIDNASKGVVECENYIINHITNYDFELSKGYINCSNTNMGGVVSKRIAQAQYYYILNHSELFDCITHMHNDQYCPASTPVFHLEKGIRALSKHSFDIDQLVIDYMLKNKIEDVCGCERTKAIFYAIQKKYELNELELFDYLNGAQSK
jgi:hypothetical protein